MSLLEAVVLGLVQGLTEFLPISSSGHLVLAKTIFGIDDKGIAFEIFSHFGTLMAVVTLFRADLLAVIKAPFDAIRVRQKHEEMTPESERGMTLYVAIIIGTIPTAFFGFLFRRIFESAFSSALFVCGALIFTGGVLLLTRFITSGTKELTNSKAFLIGLSQVIAFFPGVSRSGTTISTGLMLKVKPEEAAKFSFLLAVPLILGVTMIKSYEFFFESPTIAQIGLYGVGALSAYVSGLWAIRWLMQIVQKGRFDRFAYYCFLVGGIGLLMISLQS